MSFIERVKWGEGEPRVQKVFESIWEQRGNVPNLFRVMGRKPKLLNSFNAHFGSVLEDDRVPVRLKEILAVRVSTLNDCDY